MRFINTSTLRLEKVADFDLQDTSKYPKGYAILSHRWGRDGSEINFADFRSFDDDELLDNARLNSITAKAGWPKFKGACDLARIERFDLIWIDTCCIDKRDSVELGEAINSMYRWYSEAGVCFVYLEDVGIEGKNLRESTWFDRGWTLQELIAPREVRFYDNSWSLIGDKKTEITVMEERRGIPAKVLLHLDSPSSCSIAQRMSWAARRRTTRIEDAAYSLMGLFDVNMPMIYGERKKAFIRLQEEIKKNGDMSIFAWEMETTTPTLGKVPGYCCGMLAPSPACFENAGQVVILAPLENFGIGQTGLSIKLKCVTYGMETYLADLTSNTKPTRSLCILLAPTQRHGQFTRIRNSEGDSIIRAKYRGDDHSYFVKEFHVRQEGETAPLKMFPGFWLTHLRPSATYDCGFRVLSHAGVARYDRISIGSDWTGTAGIIRCEPRGDPMQDGRRYIQWMKFGFDREFNPVCLSLYWHPNVTRDPVPKANESTFTKATQGREVGYEREKLFHDRWLDLEYEDYGGETSFSLLKGDRENGLRARLDSPMELDVDISRVKDPSFDPSSVPHETPTREVWAVSIDRHHDGSTIYRKQQKLTSSIRVLAIKRRFRQGRN